VAAPVFKNFAAKALPHLGVLPSSKGASPPPGVHSAKDTSGRPIPNPAVAVQKSNAPKCPLIIQAKGNVEQSVVKKAAKTIKGTTVIPEPTAAHPKVTAPIPVNLYTLKAEKRDAKRID
jgi:hypothetical protein